MNVQCEHSPVSSTFFVHVFFSRFTISVSSHRFVSFFVVNSHREKKIHNSTPSIENTYKHTDTLHTYNILHTFGSVCVYDGHTKKRLTIHTVLLNSRFRLYCKLFFSLPFALGNSSPSLAV